MTSTEVCHIETHDPDLIETPDRNATCVFDDEDGECCFTQKNPGKDGYREEKCRYYDLDNYTLTALVESGDEEYQHFQNATGHWVRRHCQSALSARRSPCGHPGLASEASPRRCAEDLETVAGNSLWSLERKKDR